MAKKEFKELEEIEVASEPAPKSDRQVRWEKYVAGYMIANPVKGARKKANGEFDKIPASFK